MVKSTAKSTEPGTPTPSATMTQIDFHTNVPDKLLYTCRLIRKALNDGWQVVVFCGDDGELGKLDQVLWTFSEQDFLPHVRAEDPLAATTPVVLTSSDEAALPHHRLLVNLATVSPAHFARFERLIEVVSTDEHEVALGRERYAYYRQRGYPLKHYSRSANEQPVT